MISPANLPNMARDMKNGTPETAGSQWKMKEKNNGTEQENFRVRNEP